MTSETNDGHSIMMNTVIYKTNYLPVKQPIWISVSLAFSLDLSCGSHRGGGVIELRGREREGGGAEFAKRVDKKERKSW